MIQVFSQVQACVLSIALLLIAGSATVASAAPSDAGRYRRCLADSSANPGAALSDADSWIKSGGGAPAEHCAALALVSLKRYAEAAGRLDGIAGGRAKLDTAFRVAL